MDYASQATESIRESKKQPTLTLVIKEDENGERHAIMVIEEELQEKEDEEGGTGTQAPSAETKSNDFPSHA